MKKAHVAEYKKKVVADFAKLIKEYPIVGALNVENLPAKQFQKMREQLRDKVVIRMTKRRLIKLAIEKAKDSKKGIEELEKNLSGMPALIFSKENPFKLSSMLKKSKSRAPIKPGQIAPDDIVVKAGPTPFAPGPIIGELGSIGLKTAIEGGKVAIQREKVVANKGEPVKPEVANILSRLGIMPMEIGLDLVAIYEDGIIYTKDVLDFDEEWYLKNIMEAASESINLAVYMGYITKDTIEIMIKKAFNDSKALALSKEIISDASIEQEISKAEKAAATIHKAVKKTAESKEVEKEQKPAEEPIEEIKQEIEEETEAVQEAEELEEEKETEEIQETEETEAAQEKEIEEERKEEEIEETPEPEAEEPEELKLKDLKTGAIEVKEKVSDELFKKTEEFVKQLQARAKIITEPEAGPSVNELVERAKKFDAGERPPTAEDLLEESEESEGPVKKEQKKEPEKVPTAHELAQRRRRS